MLLLSIGHSLYAQESARRDPSPHTQQFVTIEPDVRVEVLDWGGSGQAIVLLAGLGNTAHVFDEFAPKLAPAYHVLGVTRRGFGASSEPASGYGADRLGDDVIAVLDALKLEKPVLAGHSLGGEELSSVGTRYPGRVAGLIYLDAAYKYAFDNGPLVIPPVTENIPMLPPFPRPEETDLKSFAAYRSWNTRVLGTPMPEAELRQTHNSGPNGEVGSARVSPKVQQSIIAGARKYNDIRVPVLAIFAVPHDLGPWTHNNSEVAKTLAASEVATEAQASAFEKGVKTARVVRLPHAHHYVFMSNEADVLREMRAFLRNLAHPPNPFLQQ
jgi:non-heme chloroperoxidase